MSRRIDIELTSARDDGFWTWRAAGAREPRGTLEGAILPEGAEVGQVLRAEVEAYLDGMNVVSVLPPRAPRREPERLELKPTRGGEQALVTSTLAPKRSGERGRRRNDRGREGGPGRRERRGGDRQDARHERPARPAPPPVEAKPKPKRLRPGKAHRSALLDAVPAEQRPIVEQLVAGGIPAVRQAIDKQNEALRAEGKPEVKPDALLRVAEDLRPRAMAAVWRDRAEAAVATVDDLDLRDLRSVVNAAGDAGRDDEARALATQLREALDNRVEKEHAAWLAELAETVAAGRVVRALRLSSRPPKAGAPIPGDVATQLAEATAASLTDETGPDRWATVLDALAYSPVRRRVIPQSLPTKLTPELRSTIARLATRLPDIAHIFDIEPDPTAERPARGPARRRPGGPPGKDRGKPRKDRGDKPREGERSKADKAKADKAKADKGKAKGKADKGEPDSPKSADEAKADEAKADEAKPGDEAKADEAKPGDEAKADEAKPGDEAKADEAKPVEAKPVEAEPAGETKADEAEPADEAKTADEAQPDEAKPDNEAQADEAQASDKPEVSDKPAAADEPKPADEPDADGATVGGATAESGSGS